MISAKRFLTMAAAAVLVVVSTVSCRTQTTVQNGNGQIAAGKTAGEATEVLQKVTSNAQNAQFITSKIKFKATLGDKEVSLGGNLRMKRNDVIRLQLTAFGLIEAARIEFTKDYVLVMDRINKQYIKAEYKDVEFLNQSGLNFYSLQALFWNELFLPNQSKVDKESLKYYNVNLNGTSTAIGLDNGNMHYKWSANNTSGCITDFSGSYSANGTGRIGVDWNYGSFRQLGEKQFPTSNKITVTTPKKPVSIDLQLTNPNNDSDWETRTEVSSKYKQVSLADIMRRLSSL